MFAEAVRPLAELRRKQGFDVVVSTDPVEKAVAALPRRPACIVLVGDDAERGALVWAIPAKEFKLYRWRAVQRTTFASDAALGDLDGDLVPDVPVGRLPARSTDQVKRIVDKILAYERRPAGLDDLRLPVWAGSPCYGKAIDSMSTEMLVAAVRMNAPAWAQPWLLSGGAGHALCGWPPDQPALFAKQLRRGTLAYMMGHGDRECFYSMDFKGEAVKLTAQAAAAELAKGPPGPPLVIFACDCGHFTAESDCLAESLLRLPGGPVACIAASTESHPLTNYFSGTCLLSELSGRHERVGELWLAAQRAAMKARNPLIERMLRDVEGKLENEINVAALRRDQMLMYALLGDPATRLKLPGRLHGKLVRSGDGWQWKVVRPEGATKLYVGQRPAEPKMPPTRAAVKADQARVDLTAANEALAFRPVSKIAANGKWEGFVGEAGTLRLVAVAPDRLYVAALKLKRPAMQPASTRPARQAER